MSDTNSNTHRGRRKAVRSAGPPVDEAGTVAGDVTVRLGGDAVESRSAGGGFGGGAGAVSSEGGKGAGAAGSVPLAKGGASDAGPQAKGVAGSGDAVRRSTDAAGSGVAESLTKGDRGASEAGDAGGSVPLTKSDSTDSAETAVVLSKSDAAESDSADAKADGESASETTGRPGVGRILLAAAAAVLVLALVAGAVVSVFLTRSIDERDARRAEYVQTARQAILNLTTINADSAKEDIDRILSMASGQFKTEFDGRVDPFLSIVQQAEVRSSGEIVEAALEIDADDSAKVLVAAKQTLTNAGQAEPQTRFYRFRVTVTDTDGGLTASNVEFVP
ncbi:hypothetical protein IU487_12440 [Nocardia puris]|uniref:hypothetical protein n=1 Tax=Nocardia puris TaxID=208602 RepID=UPI0018947B8A|nr:hypothetical protein [Nocardia puris]MBF6211845.1 hypothetical protein [Nocardia puris]